MSDLNKVDCVTPTSEAVVVGHNSEYADADNPRGEIVRLKFVVEASTPRGTIFRHKAIFDTLEQAVAFSDKVQNAIDIGVSLNPEHWLYNRVRYGSEAYDGYNEDELISLERDLERDFF